MADREFEGLKEEIKFEIEMLRLAAITALAIGGGSIGLLLGEMTFFRLILAVIGLLRWG